MEYSDEIVETTASRIVYDIDERCFMKGEFRQELIEEREMLMVRLLEQSVKKLNSQSKTRKHWKVGDVAKVLDERGIEYSVNGNEIKIMVNTHTCHIRSHYGLRLALGHRINGSLVYCYCAAEIQDIIDLVDFILRVDRKSCEKVEDMYQEYQRDILIGDIEYPTIEFEVKEFCEKRNITYSLYKDYGQVILRVHIRNCIWAEKQVTIDSIKGDLGIIPYLLVRPDRIEKDGNGFRVVG